MLHSSSRILIALLAVSLGVGASAATSPAVPTEKPVLFNTAFESGSIGLIEKLSETEFRLHIRGQQDSRGRNRQATWFYFRMDDVAGGGITPHPTALKGEDNHKPAPAPAGRLYRALFS